MKTCIAFLTKDRVELTEQSIEPLLGLDADIFWCDGSATEKGRDFPYRLMAKLPPKHRVRVMSNVVGGPDAAVAYALTAMLKGSDYSHVGLVENDVLLHRDWFGPTMALFERGPGEGLVVGAASARCYEDRVLIQREGFAVCQNLGWGMQILTRDAAKLTLKHFRTSWTTENRRLFAQVSGVDIGRYWAFRGGENMLCADWGNDRMLAAHGLASVALTPSPVEMIGQVPPLAEQGLKLVNEPVELLRDEAAFGVYRERTRKIRAGEWRPAHDHFLRDGTGTIIFPHQVREIGGTFTGDWRLKWTMGFGPFAYRAGDGGEFPFYHTPPLSSVPELQHPQLTVPVAGAVDFLVSGGPDGGLFRVDDDTGFSASPELPPGDDKVVSVHVPAGVNYRHVMLTALNPGVIFYGLRVRDPQPVFPQVVFDHDILPGV